MSVSWVNRPFLHAPDAQAEREGGEHQHVGELLPDGFEADPFQHDATGARHDNNISSIAAHVEPSGTPGHF